MGWISAKLAKRSVWSIAIFFQDRLTLPPEGAPAIVFDSRRLLRGPWQPHTRADPFLFAHQDRLYIFYETQSADDPGRIEAAELTREGARPLGTILSEPFHLSYPCVFRHQGNIYLIPEAQGSGELRLYRFADFPRNPRLLRVLARGRFADPSPLYRDGQWYIFTTTDRGLEILVTDDLENGAVAHHPLNPITADRSVSRCGGLPIEHDGILLRVAQDCSETYGANLHLMQIEDIGPSTYREVAFRRNLFKCDQAWNAQGGHHLSIAEADGKFAVAVDGQAFDFYIHKFLLRGWLTCQAIGRRLVPR